MHNNRAQSRNKCRVRGAWLAPDHIGTSLVVLRTPIWSGSSLVWPPLLRRTTGVSKPSPAPTAATTTERKAC